MSQFREDKGCCRAILLGLEQKDGTVAEVEIDEVLGLCKVVSLVVPLYFLSCQTK